MKRKYLVTITMHDGSQGQAWGFFENDWKAIDAYMTAFYTAKSVTARRMS